ncbi:MULTISPECIES: flavin reductase family protein [unclassified Meridianimarinicoccus]|uniref:flavin reductase family protein n=1 Tax=unclassified Meridianimarinicoccus TaxID=2923344 RepID=UPI001866DF15|nr:flavin reductase family protein [Fluviibacterium sp. MJW13]
MDGSSAISIETFQPAPDTQRAYRTALGSFGTGVTVITTTTDLGPCAITVNSFASVSLDPALVLWSVDKASDRCAAFAEASHSAIHVLERSQQDLAWRFARDGFDFAQTDWQPDGNGVPCLDGCLTRFDCETVATHDGGDHIILVSKVSSVSARHGLPLLFVQGKFGSFSTS